MDRGVRFVGGCVGALFYMGLFWLGCLPFGWEPPGWAYFIVAWMGHNDFFDWATFKKQDWISR